MIYPTQLNVFGSGLSPQVSYKYDRASSSWKKHYNIYDHLGTLSQTYKEDVSGIIPTSMQTHNPYGGDRWTNSNLTETESTLLNWVGKEKDNESKLGDHGVRKYEYETGRFISIDPLWGSFYGWTPYQYSMNSPVITFDANGEKPTPFEAVTMIEYNYGSISASEISGGWTVSNAFSELHYSSSSDFNSMLFERTVDGVTEYSLVTRGTVSLHDWLNNGEQLVGLSEQYEESAKLADELDRKAKNFELTFVGHSMGGGQAALNSMKTGRNAMSFNAAGVSYATMIANGAFMGSNNIDAYIMRFDPLNIAQSASSYDILPSADGNVKIIDSWTLESIYNGHAISNFRVLGGESND